MPPKGMSTLPAPIVESNRSERPLRLHPLRPPTADRRLSSVSSAPRTKGLEAGSGSSIVTSADCATPLVSRKERSRETMV